jgi:hypothetical protein
MQQKVNHKSHKRLKDLFPKFSTTKVPTSPLRSPQRIGSLSTLNLLSCPKVKLILHFPRPSAGELPSLARRHITSLPVVLAWPDEKDEGPRCYHRRRNQSWSPYTNPVTSLKLTAAASPSWAQTVDRHRPQDPRWGSPHFVDRVGKNRIRFGAS